VLRPLIALAVLALPLPALAEGGASGKAVASPQMAAAVVPAWSFAGATTITQPPVVIRERARMEEPAKPLPVREKAEWRDGEGLRIAGTKVAYLRRF
jgi:hypothetical protein